MTQTKARIYADFFVFLMIILRSTIKRSAVICALVCVICVLFYQLENL